MLGLAVLQKKSRSNVKLGGAENLAVVLNENS